MWNFKEAIIFFVRVQISQRVKIDLNCKSIVVAEQSVMSQYKSLNAANSY